MTDRQWQRLLSAPAPPDVNEPAARARKAALHRFDEETEAAPRRWLIGFVSAAALGYALIMAHSPVAQPPASERLQVKWRLSDGTSVHWVLDDSFTLRGGR